MKYANDTEFLKDCRDTYQSMRAEREKWLPMWRQLNEAFSPFLYAQLQSSTALTSTQPYKVENTKMLDGEPCIALIILAAGYMNGVTSPARKWINIKRPGTKPYEEGDNGQSAVHSSIRTKILEVLAGSNYYECRAEQVFDACGLGTGAILIYEDRDTVATFTNCPPGSYCLATDNSNRITKFGREFKMKARDLVKEFGEENVPKDIVNRAKKSGAEARTEYLVTHLIEENDPSDGGLRTNHPFREFFWLSAKFSGGPCFLARRPLYEWPVAVLRWACPDKSTYGIPPTLAVRGKAIQLQNLEYQSDQGLDKMLRPPLLAHTSMKNRPKAFGAGGITYTNDLSAGNGARPAYQVQVPFQELGIKRQQIIQAIKDGLYNYLFNQFSQLDTVRSATEIDARREEQMTVLGPVLHRGYGEDIGIVVKRVFGICSRKKLLQELPDGEGAEIEFSNILSDVQKASDVGTIERFTAYAAQIIPVWPQAQPKVNILDLLKQYAEGLGIRPSSLVTDDEAMQAMQPQQDMQQLLQTSEVAKNFGGAGAGLSKVDVGGGLNAVQALLG